MRKVSTMDGLSVLLRGGSQRQALAADDAYFERAAEQEAQDAELAKARVERAKLDNVEQRLRLEARIRRRQRRSAGSEPTSDADTRDGT